MTSNKNAATGALEASKRTGIEIVEEEMNNCAVLRWTGEYGGRIKPVGPLAGKRVGVLVASEFSDFQVYYLASYVGEYGGTCEFLLVDWVRWKYTRPNIANKGVRGMWDINVDPMLVMMGSNKAELYKSLKEADASDYDAVIIVGGHSADVMVTEPEVIDFCKSASDNGATLGTIGEGSMVLIAAGLVQNKRCTGNRLVDFMLKKIAVYEPAPVVVDGKLITARDTVDTPAFLRALCKAFDPSFDARDQKDVLRGKRVMLMIGEDFEDIEVIVPAMEFLYRGAELIVGRFEPQFKGARAPSLSTEYAVGNFGSTIPFQEIPDNLYSVRPLDELKMNDFDLVCITGAFNPWNVVATGRTEFLKDAYAAGKIVAAICHGPIPVAAADLVDGKDLCGWKASKDAVEIMGGTFSSDWAAVVHGRIVTGRTPPELCEFLDAMTVALLMDG